MNWIPARMDGGMHSYECADFALDPPALADFVIRDLTSGKDVTLLVDSSYGAAALEYAAVRLRGGRDRVVCVSAATDGGLDCAGFLRQLRQSAEQYGREPTGGVEENNIAFLTTLDPSCDRIVLLVSHAEALEHGALLAIQLACRASIRLRLVFAGQPSLLTTLDHPELSTLEGRLLRGVQYTLAAADSDGAEPVAVWSGRSQRSKLVTVVAACVVLAISGLVTRWSLMQDDPSDPVSGQAAAISSALPTLPSEPTVHAAGEATVNVAPEPLEAPEPNVSPALPGNAAVDFQPAPNSRAVRGSPSQSVGHSGRRGFALRETKPLRGNEARVIGARAGSEHRHTLPPTLAEQERSADYIGTFAAGPDGVRTFQYGP